MEVKWFTLLINWKMLFKEAKITRVKRPSLVDAR
jgi:hypothetical protein